MRPDEVLADRFVIEREVAAGGMGRVYRAVDRHTGARVAVKVILDPEHGELERFRREAAALAEISHPSIVRYVAHGVTTDDRHYLVMEWLDGEDLAAHLRVEEPPTNRFDTPAPGSVSLKSRRVVTIADALVFARKVGEALGELHRRGLVHRDVKPANVFLVSGALDQPKLLDFGIARRANAKTVTRTGVLVGTPQYMAPEQARGARSVDARADVWALGCVLYELLTGRPPFVGEHAMAVLAKILMDDPPRAVELAPDLPSALDALVMRMLSKDPTERPLDGAAAAAAIAEIERTLDADVSSAAPSWNPNLGPPRFFGKAAAPREPASISNVERRVHCVVVTGSGSARPTPESTVASGVDLSAFEDVRRVVEAHGGRIEPIRDGSLLVSLAGARTATDQAARAARVALAMRAILRDVPFVVVTGRAAGTLPTSVGALVDRAVRDLLVTPPGTIRVDGETAELLGARFVVDHPSDRGAVDRPSDRAAYLAGERDAESEQRLLLGRPTPLVGRDRELRVVEGIWEECVCEPIARAVLVTAPAGAGKSRVRTEIVRRLRARGEPIEVFFAQGDALGAGSPFAMIAPALRRACGVLDGEPLEDRREKLRARVAKNVDEPHRRRVAELLGELCGIPMVDPGSPDESEALRAARRDPMLMGDAMRTAFEDFLAAEVATQPVLFVLEDLHWGDLPAVRFLDSALRNLRDAPFMVLALARPEVHGQFPGLWAERALQEIRLDALTKRAAERLVKDVLGERATPDVVSGIVERAGGNAFFLEELIRAVASGEGDALPDTVLATLHARLDALGVEAKRVLRAASVFGELFWRGGVRALVGGERATLSVSDWLDDLVEREVIQRHPAARIPGEIELSFRHALVRDAAYEMLTEADRVLAHRLAGEWLEAVGERDALVLAEHFHRGDDPARASGWYKRAAEQALEGNDLAAAIERADRALTALDRADDDNTATRGALRLLQAVASYWRSAYADGQRHAAAAVELLEAGSAAWFRAAAEAAVSSARRGEYEHVDRFVASVREAAPMAGAEAAQIVALCRGTFQLIFAGRFDAADAILEEVAARAGATTLDPATRAQVHHVRGVRWAHGGRVGQFLVELEAAIAAFDEAGDTRNVALETPTVGWCYAELGDFARAEALLRDAMDRCERLGVQQTKTYAQVNLGYVLDYRGRDSEAETALLEAGESCRKQGNPRLEGWSRAHLARVYLGRGDLDAAEREARTAEELLVVSPGLRAWARATLARVLLAKGRAEDARAPAESAHADLVRLGSMLQGESLPPLVRAEVLDALGDHEAARAAIVDARDRLLVRADALPDPAWRASFLALPDNARTLSLVEAWGVPPV